MLWMWWRSLYQSMAVMHNEHTVTHTHVSHILTTPNPPHTHLMVVRVSHIDHLVTVVPHHAQWVLETSLSPFSIHITKRKQVLQFRDTCRQRRDGNKNPSNVLICDV